MKNRKQSKRICVIGDGGWGTALALLLHDNGHNVTIWGPFPDYIKTIRKSGFNKIYLPGVKIPAGIKWTSDRQAAIAGAEIAVLAVPTKYFRDVLQSFAGLIPESCGLVSVAKGFDRKTRKRISQVAREILGPFPIAALSGPSYAEEVARKTPTAVAIASEDAGYCRKLQKIFSNNRFRVYTTNDIIGTELGGAMKNVIAIAAGISDGLGFGNNTRAALITRGLAEIMRLGCAMGAHASTFAGLSGMGDLIVTCTSRQSRNHTVGERLGKGEKINDILSDMKQVAEGAWNCSIVRDLANELGIEAPITSEVYAVIHKGKNPLSAVKSLMSRDVKPE